MTVPSVDAPRSAEAVVQEQLDAYNARDLERFSAVYDERVRVFRPPTVEPAMLGRAALVQFYTKQRFHLLRLHADLIHRTVLGKVIVDHRRISGVNERPFEVVVVYEVAEERIQTVWFFSGR